jgi:site-specific DNA recombinase
MTQPIIVDIYCRVATASPESDGRLAEQELACRLYCREPGLTVANVYRDMASGAQYHRRPGLTSLRARYRHGITNGEVIPRVDRLTRRQAHFIMLSEEMQRYGITLYTAAEKLEENLLYLLRGLTVAVMVEVEQERALDQPPTEPE